ncbi:MAG TPA: DUF4179 domain-containing protein [Firmicutes bacterium]|nr:DUF4179 domain-containing protein [Candidatus Fermentithermobacillaceae bacterium]
MNREIEMSVEETMAMEHLMEKGLSGLRPKRSVLEILSDKDVPHSIPARTRIVRAGAALVACLALIVSVASFKIPALAEALASVPILGAGYTALLQQWHLDVAYQLGLIAQLDKKDTREGITLRVISACSDPTQTVIVFSVTGETEEAKAILTEEWVQSGGDDVAPVQGQSGKGTLPPEPSDAEKQPLLDFKVLNGGKPLEPCFRVHNLSPVRDGETGYSGSRSSISSILGSITVGPVDRTFWGETLTLVMTCRDKPGVTWKADFPVRVFPDTSVKKIAIGREMVSGDMRVRADYITLAPTQTVIECTVSSASGEHTPLPPEKLLFPSHPWTIQTSDGKVLHHHFALGKPSQTGAWIYRWFFEPVSGGSFSVFFQPTRTEDTLADLKPEKGAKVTVAGVEIFVEDFTRTVTDKGDKINVEFLITGPRDNPNERLTLVYKDAQGKVVHHDSMSAPWTESVGVGFYLDPSSTMERIAVVHTRFIPEGDRIEVYRGKR